MWITDIASAFDREKLDYAIVGGFAVALHGAVRGTMDLDLVLRLREKDFVAAEVLLRNLGFESRLPVSGKEVFRFRKEYTENRNLIAWSFYDPKTPLRQIDIIITQDLNNIKIDIKKVGGVPLRVASIKSLISMKEESGRPQDLEDIKALKVILKREPL